MDIEVLGRPAVRVAGERRELTGRQPALLAALVVAAPRPVSPDTLLEAVWGDALPKDPANALQQRISALRQTLTTGDTDTPLVTLAGGYALQVADEDIDARCFAREATDGRDHLAAGEPERALARLEQALGRWRADAFDGLRDEAWLLPEIHRLHELRLTALEDRSEALLRMDAGPELLPELQDLVTAEPLRERVCGQLMRALYRAGRQADALAQYEQTRQLLADELGVDPGPALRRLHLQILEQADELEVAAVAAPRRRRSTTNLPAATRTIIGRADAVEQTRELLAVGRLVTLTGPGGAGKTTVALEAARCEPVPEDGSWLVELAPVADVSALAGAVAAAVDLHAGAGAGPPTDLDTLVEALRDRDMLLVLDNAEHVITQVAELAAQVLARAPAVRTLVTSREPLALDGELVWSLPPLGVPREDEQDVETVRASPSVALLVDRIRAHNPTFHLDDRAVPAAAAIARRLDGIPLAIDLAAARARVLSLPQLASALDDRFALLATTNRGTPSRQRTLRAAIDWSWELLDDAQRRAWAALSVAAGPLDLELASQLLHAAEVGGDPLDRLRELVDRSVLIPQTAATVARFRMLESLKAYGQERLAELGIDEVVRAGHADAVREGLATCNLSGARGGFPMDLAGLGDVLDEARTALRWADDTGERDRVASLAGRLGWLWLLRGLATEGLAWLDRGLGAVNGAPPDDLPDDRVDPEALLWASGLRTAAASPCGSAWAERSLQADLAPDRRVLAELFAGVHRAHAGEVELALTELRRSVDLARPLGGWILGFAHLVVSQIGRISGQVAVVREHAAAGLELISDGWARAQLLDILIDAIDPLQDPEYARQLATEGLALCRRAEVPELEGRMLLQLGVAADVVGEHELAATYLTDAIELTAQAGHGTSLGFALLVAGERAQQHGELRVARQRLTEATELLAGTGMTYGSARAQLALSRTLHDLDEPEAAAETASEAARLAASVGDPELTSDIDELRASIRDG